MARDTLRRSSMRRYGDRRAQRHADALSSPPLPIPRTPTPRTAPPPSSPGDRTRRSTCQMLGEMMRVSEAVPHQPAPADERRRGEDVGCEARRREQSGERREEHASAEREKGALRRHLGGVGSHGRDDDATRTRREDRRTAPRLKREKRRTAFAP